MRSMCGSGSFKDYDGFNLMGIVNGRGKVCVGGNWVNGRGLAVN